MAEGGDVHQVGIFRVHPDLADVVRVGQAHVLPRLASVGRLVDPVAIRDIETDCRLSHPGIDDVRIGI